MLMTDYYSNYPELIELSETTSNKVISEIKAIFSRYGIPQTLVSDNGP